MLQGKGALLPPLGEEGEQSQHPVQQMLTWRPQAVDGEGEKVGTDLRVLAQVIQRPRGIFAAWLENAMAALVLRQEQIPAHGEVA